MIVSTAPKITDASVDKKGRLTLTYKLAARIYQTVRLDIVKFETKQAVDYKDIGIGSPFIVKGSSLTTGSIDFISDKFSVSTKRPARKQ